MTISSGNRFKKVLSVILKTFLLTGYLLLTVPLPVQGSEPTKMQSLEPFHYVDFLQTTGKLKPNRRLILDAKLSEDVDALPVSEGDTIDTNTTIVQFDTSLPKIQLNRAEHRKKRARHQMEIARKNFNRKKSLRNKDLTSESEYDQSQLEFNRARENYRIAQEDHEEAKVRFSYSQVTSPFPGILEEKLVELGERVNRGQPLVKILQLDPLEVVFKVTSHERHFLNSGEAITVSVSNDNQIMPGSDTEPLQGTITSISNNAGNNGLYTVKSKINNTDNKYFPGTTVNIKTKLRTIKKAVKIPLTYIDRTGDEPKIVLYNSKKETMHKKSFEIIDYRKQSVVTPMNWPSSWKLVAGGIYTESPTQPE